MVWGRAASTLMASQKHLPHQGSTFTKVIDSLQEECHCGLEFSSPSFFLNHESLDSAQSTYQVFSGSA